MQRHAVSNSHAPPNRWTLTPSGDPMLAARFTVPGPPRRVVRRPELLNRLTTGVRRPLTLLNGPTGAGKTVLAAQWITAGLAPHPTVWLTVEPGDAPGVFWAYVLEAFDRHRVKLPGDLDRPTSAEGVSQSFLVRLAEGLAESAEPVILVLDQFDSASGHEITEGLRFVLRHAADGLRLVLTSTTDTLLPLHRYRAADEITEIRNADLKFSTMEAAALLREHELEISRTGIRRLVERTDGWAAGLRLCALTMQRSADPEAFAREFAADRTAIADYLVREVLDGQAPPVQDLLLRTCVTDRIHPELADVLTGRDDAEWNLATLARANAFVERVDGTAWYRLHPLFAEVLHTHLRHRCPGLEPGLHQRAAHWLADAGQLTEALIQAAAGGDWQFATDQLADNLALGRLLNGPDRERLSHAFAAMPPDLTGAAPALVRAACRLAEHDLDGCTAALRRADAHLSDAANPARRLGRALLGLLAGRQAGDLAAVEQAAAEADRLLGELPKPLLGKRPEIRALLPAGLGAAHLGAGRAGAGDPSPPLVEALSVRELEVLRQAARMLSTEEIAVELYVSANTVKTHLKSIHRKLSVTRRSEAVHRAEDLGML
ncbi:ATP/maltotriose-dependent transcriptional regulator MalT [Kitasatospora sp. MAA4]|uniref:helix-turn-helix transcriptional regulator n=1 Tax=Kitasatospora sp. MAA4 TaxID=3035093 RepID=UPI0024740AB7|nr:LuxR family transcriptional regulator [Kitasatospora sp. MAA4]MDH6137190.1 ATP/maltotriose-dependent transcriptional regulator MalT [Kitasatospora sp. MAA4]